jgi:hypothetical protein
VILQLISTGVQILDHRNNIQEYVEPLFVIGYITKASPSRVNTVKPVKAHSMSREASTTRVMVDNNN